jgi:APA family basic amino acid/polyamine antiporter
MDLFRTKSADELREASFQESHYRRDLHGWQLVLLGIGCIIGTGIFVLTGTAAAQHAGPAIAISFVVSAAGCLCAALCYAEFSSMIPVSGSAYTYAYATVGELVAWIIGWDLILEYLFGASTVAVGWSGYVSQFFSDFGIHLPTAFSHAPFDFAGDHLVTTGAILNIPAVFIVAIVTTVLVLGIRESAGANAVIVFIKVAVVLLFIITCAPHIQLQNWTPFIPPNTGQAGEFGWTGILAGAGVIFYAYIGFDAVTTAAQEAKTPARDVPLGVVGSLLICTVLYVLVSLVLTGVVSYQELNVPAPVAFAVEKVGPAVAWTKPFIELGAIAGLSSVILVLLLAQPRIFHRMALDGLLPKIFSRVHPHFRTPFVTTLVTGTVTALIAGLFPVKVLGELVSIGTLLAFTIVCVSVIVLRRTRPDLERRFRTPWNPWVPALGVVICLAQMIFLPAATWTRLAVWLVIGLIIYFAYGRRHSLLNSENQSDTAPRARG